MATAENTAELLRVAAREHPDREAYVHGEKRVTYAWLDRAADGFAASLLDLGVAPGDVVCLMLASSIKFAACYLGALRAGAITSAINLRLGVNEQASILARTDPAVTVLGDGAEIPRRRRRGQGAPRLRARDRARPRAGCPTPASRSIAPTDPACIVWTSGTTGAPKGAVYDHARMAAISRNMGQLTEPGDRRLVVLPFAHVGYMTRMWDELANGTTIVLAGEPWSAAETLRLIRDEHITMGTGVPTQWELVLAHPDLARTDFSRLRVCGIGGAAISPDLVRRMRETLGCPVISRYTSTEAGVTTSTVDRRPRRDRRDDRRPRRRPRSSCASSRPATGSRAARRARWARSSCRSPAMMRGYWRDPELTATVDRRRRLAAHRRPRHRRRRRQRAHRRAAQGDVHPRWLQRVPDRGRGGARRPSRRRPGRGGRAARPGARRGRRGVRGRRRPGAPPELADLRDWCRARIADYKAPDRLVVVDALPVTPMHKIDKAALRAIYETTEET